MSDVKTLLEVAFMFKHGRGVVQDLKEAANWVRLAADQGDASAQYALGVMYHYGRGVVQDHKEAAKWFRLVAAQGDADSAEAQFHLGDMYKDGLGVVQNYVQAHMWYNLSAANGYPDVFKQRDEVATKMTSAQIAQAQEMAQRCQASNYKNCD